MIDVCRWPLLASFALVAADARIFDKGAKAPPITNPASFIVVYRPGVDMTSSKCVECFEDNARSNV